MADHFSSSVVSTRQSYSPNRVEMPNGTGNFQNFQISRKKDNLRRLSTIFETNFQKRSVPFDFVPEFPEILVKWIAPEEYCNHLPLGTHTLGPCSNNGDFCLRRFDHDHQVLFTSSWCFEHLVHATSVFDPQDWKRGFLHAVSHDFLFDTLSQEIHGVCHTTIIS